MNHQRPDPETAVDRPAPRRWRIARRFVVPLGIAGCLAVAVARCPQLLASPRFWAEEGRDYFAYAFAHGPLAGLLASHLGYYALVTNASAALASVVPLEHAPLVTTAIALLVQLAVSALVLTSVSSLWCGGAATLAIALAVQLLA